MGINPVLSKLSLSHINTYMYLPPITWKGDIVGHIGQLDTFFWVLEGECFLIIEDEAYIVGAGQLAFLPKGKMRTYTHISERFVMYEMAFSAESSGQALFDLLGFTSGDYVVDIPEQTALTELFENSHRIEKFKSPVYSLAALANLTNIIRLYTDARLNTGNKDKVLFENAIAYMKASTDKVLRTSDLSATVFMQPTYFIRKFTKAFSMSPQTYFSRLKLMKAMHLLASTDLSIEEVAAKIGITDTSYFSRFFKKHCRLSPTEYRKAFR